MAEKSVLRTAYEVLKRITAGGAFANLALKESLKQAEAKTASSVTALVYTTLENSSYEEYLIAHYAKGRVQGSIKNVLSLGITELLFMDTPDHAAVNGAAELTRSIGKAKLCGFVNGVLRTIARDNAENKLFPLPDDPAERLSVRFGIPNGLAGEYVRDYGLEFTEDMLSSRVHELTVRAQYPFTTEALKAELGACDIAYTEGRYDNNALVLDCGVNIAELPLFNEGKLTVQSESAMLSVRACRVREGMKVLDTCAAPGGKSAYLASLMRNTGSITAWEMHEHRTELMRETFKRLGVTNCIYKTLDASKAPDIGERYDIVLCDAPCSGLGGGGKPDALIRRTDEAIAELADIQLKILLNAANFVKEGGALVYSTCTVSRCENEGNIERFLEKRPDFEPESLAWLLCDGNGESGGNEPAELAERRGRLGTQLFPNIDGMDGFYIARLIKKAENNGR
ncbi:MAG: 16S rRNA (cytosine(967)-C(5))-methyltransferase RsmB [Clostridia bacterium]|nr:16S rRNA (cytosine(967)-C(5))-methyltransferase RsmB [Clostridia bacterium]